MKIAIQTDRRHGRRVKCVVCGKRGQSARMVCRDCCADTNVPVPEQLATRCRECCPTGHGTHGATS